MADAAREAAFEALVGEVHGPIRRYLRRRCAAADLDEVMNDFLTVMWRRLDDVPSGSVLPWCYGVARRCLANHRRAGSRRLRLVERLSVGAAAARTTEVDAAPASDVDVALHEALGRLPDLDREMMRLWAWEQLEPREIATVLEMTPNAVSVRLSRTKRRLEGELSRQDRDPAGHIPHEASTEPGS